jgi:hypothetical protein
MAMLSLLRALSQQVPYQRHTNVSQDEHFLSFERDESLRSRL